VKIFWESPGQRADGGVSGSDPLIETVEITGAPLIEPVEITDAPLIELVEITGVSTCSTADGYPVSTSSITARAAQRRAK
jgi:hypothetical protein